MPATEIFMIPMPNGETATLSREHYETLVGGDHLTAYSLTTVGAAAQILSQVITDATRSLREIVRLIHEDPEVEPSASERRAIVALVAAALVEQVGKTSTARYRLAPALD